MLISVDVSQINIKFVDDLAKRKNTSRYAILKTLLEKEIKKLKEKYPHDLEKEKDWFETIENLKKQFPEKFKDEFINHLDD